MFNRMFPIFTHCCQWWKFALYLILSVKIFVIKTTWRMLFNPAWKVLSWIISDSGGVQMVDKEDVWCSLPTQKQTLLNVILAKILMLSVLNESFMMRCLEQLTLIVLLVSWGWKYSAVIPVAQHHQRQCYYQVSLILIDKSCIYVTFYWVSLDPLLRPRRDIW